jgi:hypothetical protein
MQCAIVENGVVVNSVIADAPQGENWIESDAGIGYAYDGNTFTAPPLPPAPPPAARHITRLAFLSRFTDAEAVTIDLASIGATVPAASMRRYMSKVNAATFIDLDREDTRVGVTGLETAGVLAVGRALIILDGEILDIERYRG